MDSTKIMMLEGPKGHTFFWRETLLSQGVAHRVDLVRDVNAAVEGLTKDGPYDLVVVDLDQCWEDGLQLGYWCNQQASACPVLLLVSPETSYDSPAQSTVLVRQLPLSLHDFAEEVRNILH